jgi:hypothetical protein
LLKHEIAPRLFGPDAKLRNRLSELLAGMGSACNGENKTSRQFVSILNSLTAREDLSGTTMGFCRGFVCSRFLVRVEQAWCSACLGEWREEGRELYWPLLWNIMAVKTCPRHNMPLRTSCPACGRKFHPLVARSRPGFCQRCRHWLGADGIQSNSATPEFAVEVAIAKTVSEFLRDGPAALRSERESVFPRNIETLLTALAECFQNKIKELSRYIGINPSSIVEWKTGRQRPTLLSLMDVSHKLKVSPVALLSTELSPDKFMIQPQVSAGTTARRQFTSPPRTNLELMRRVLEEAVNNDLLPQPSLSELAAKLECRQTTLARRFPDLVKRVKERYQVYFAARKESRANLFRSVVRKAVLDIHNAGEYPSQWKVRQALPSFADMREPAAYDEWKRTLIELSLR